MHASTKQLYRSQFVTQELKEEQSLELTFFEKGSAKSCRTLSTLSRKDRARLMALLREGFLAVSEGADPEAIAAVIRSEVQFDVR